MAKSASGKITITLDKVFSHHHKCIETFSVVVPHCMQLIFLLLPLKHPVSAAVCPSNASCPASISRATKQAGEHNEAAKEPDVYLSSVNSGQEEHGSE